MPTRPRRKPRRRVAGRKPALDRHFFYSPAVQHVEHDLEVLAGIFRLHNGRFPQRLREDFCGTAAAACEWVRRGPRHRAWGVDLDRATLDWARRHRLPPLGPAVKRLALIQGDVRRVVTPPVDMVLALNFSYWVFHSREALRGYFRAARRSLRRGGLLCLDIFGGTDAAQVTIDRRHVHASRGPGGERVPPFGYEWEQSYFNPVDYRLRCHITFRLKDGRVMRRAFSYDWRLWTLPELRELLAEAGFRESIVYVQDWDDDEHEPLGSYTARRRFDNQLTWLAFVIGVA